VSALASRAGCGVRSPGCLARERGCADGCSLHPASPLLPGKDELGKCALSFNRLIDALVSSREVEAATSDFTSTLSSHLDIAVLTEKALLMLKDHARATAGAVLLEKGGELATVAQHGFTATDRLCRSDHVREALRALECRRIEFPENAVIDGLVADLQPREVAVLPVAYKELVLGAVILAKTQVFTPEDLKLLNLFRQSFGLALHNAVVHDRMQRMAALDPLTGVYNRRFGMTRLNEELNRALRTKTPLGIVLYDIDHFKNVNDTYGHLVGDRVLVQVVRASLLVLREGDILIRYGGEEFLLILPGASKENSAQVTERIRRAVADTVIRDGEQSIHVTVSAGVTAFRGENREDPIELIRLADSALYTAKENGRDQVVVNWQTGLGAVDEVYAEAKGPGSGR